MSELPPIDYSLIDAAGAGSWIFYPRRDHRPAPQDATDFAVEVASGVRVASRLYVRDPALPTILYFHGNGEVASDYDGIAPLFHAAGANLWVADYRGYGASTGSPSFAALVGDAHAVHAQFEREIEARGLSGLRFLMGRSLGAHPATELAARTGDRFAGLIIESGAVNLRRMAAFFGAGGTGERMEALLAAHERKVAAISLRTLIIHGDQDELIPVEHAIDLHERLTCEKHLVILPGAGHNDILWVGRERYFEAVGRFLAGEAP